MHGTFFNGNSKFQMKISVHTTTINARSTGTSFLESLWKAYRAIRAGSLTCFALDAVVGACDHGLPFNYINNVHRADLGAGRRTRTLFRVDNWWQVYTSSFCFSKLLI